MSNHESTSFCHCVGLIRDNIFTKVLLQITSRQGTMIREYNFNVATTAAGYALMTRGGPECAARETVASTVT